MSGTKRWKLNLEEIASGARHTVIPVIAGGALATLNAVQAEGGFTFDASLMWNTFCVSVTAGFIRLTQKWLKNSAAVTAALLVLCTHSFSYAAADESITINARDIVESGTSGGEIVGTGRGEELHWGGDWLPNQITFPAAAESLWATSTATADTFFVRVHGLDSNWNPISSAVKIEGGADKNVGGRLWWRTNYAEVHGSTTNAGGIIIHAGARYDTSQVRLVIPPGYGETRNSNRSVAAGRRLELKSLYGTMTPALSGGASNSDGLLAIKARTDGKPWKVVDTYLFRVSSSGSSTPIEIAFVDPVVLPPKTDMVVAAAVTASATVDLTVRVAATEKDD